MPHCSGRGATARPLGVIRLAVETSLCCCCCCCPAGAAGGDGNEGGATLDWAALIRPSAVLLLCICCLLVVHSALLSPITLSVCVVAVGDSTDSDLAGGTPTAEVKLAVRPVVCDYAMPVLYVS